MADKNFTQWRSSSSGRSSSPDTILTNYVSNFKDYCSFRISDSESIMVIGEYNNGKYNDSIVYTYDSDTRTILKSEYDSVVCTISQDYYARGNFQGVPSVPTYTIEDNISGVIFRCVIIALVGVGVLLSHFRRLAHRNRG